MKACLTILNEICSFDTFPRKNKRDLFTVYEEDDERKISQVIQEKKIYFTFGAIKYSQGASLSIKTVSKIGQKTLNSRSVLAAYDEEASNDAI